MASDKHSGPVKEGELPSEFTFVAARVGCGWLTVAPAGADTPALPALGLWPRQFLSCSVPRQQSFEPLRKLAHVVDFLPARGALRSSTRRAASSFGSYMELNEVCWHLGSWGKELAEPMLFSTCQWRVVPPDPLDFPYAGFYPIP